MPAGDCFDAAFLRLSKQAVFQRDVKRYIVHGVVSGASGSAAEGLRYLHGWVEYEDPATGLVMVEDCSNDQEAVLPAALYYALGQIDPEQCVHYSRSEVCEKVSESGHSGPWDPDHLRIMRTQKGVVEGCKVA